MVLLCSLCFAAVASAQAVPAAPPKKALSSELGAGVLGAALGVGLGVGLGYGYRRLCAPDDADGDDLDCLLGGISLAGTTVFVAAPVLAAAGVTWVGRAHDERGRFGFSLLGAFAGSLVGACVGVGIYFAVQADDDRWLAAPALSTALGAGGGATLAFRLSARGRAKRALSFAPFRARPTADRQGAELLLSGEYGAFGRTAASCSLRNLRHPSLSATRVP